jgi:hypothetical protein
MGWEGQVPQHTLKLGLKFRARVSASGKDQKLVISLVLNIFIELFPLFSVLNFRLILFWVDLV